MVKSTSLTNMVPNSISGPEKLITSHAAVCAGFLSQARAKSRKASPYVKEAIELWEKLQKAHDVHSLLKLVSIDTLAAACGFSEKSQGHFIEAELKESVSTELAAIVNQAGDRFRDEVLYRYLLTRGDTLGGEMRNYTGASAQAQFTRIVVRVVRESGQRVQHEQKGQKITRISWDARLILFDRKPKLLNNNVDVLLLKNPGGGRTAAQILQDPSCYVACGELKGGVDPAGADEHWKTASGALTRIRERFKGDCPKLFFAGAAIEESMAREIFKQLEEESLTFAANLTVNEQAEELVRWLVSL